MDFILDQHSPLPAHVQIQEQVKLALLLGRLRPGDTLPSIRDVEKQIGISRNIVRKAYLALRSSGVLKLWHGKGVVVDKDLRYGDRSSVSRKCEEVSRKLLPRLRQMGVSPTSFARYFYQQAREDETRQPFIVFVDTTRRMAEERASRISAVWQTVVPGITIEDIENMGPVRLKRISKILTNHMRYDEVLKAVNGKEPEVIPLGLAFDPFTVREWKAFPRGAKVVYVMHDRDYPYLSLILQLYHKILVDPSINIASIAFSQISDLARFVKSTKYQKIIFSTRVWDDVPKALKRNAKVTYARMTVDLGSLENARIRAGIII